MKISWIDGSYTDVSLSSSGDLISVVDSDTGLAGAINRNGEVVIPIKNSTFDPWTGEVIKGLRQDGTLFWVISDERVGIVNEQNEEIISQSYGYLKKGNENQFIAGQGEKSNVVSSGGVYVHKKYGVIDENEKVIIPIEYDSIEALDDGGYRGVIETNTATITRTFYNNGEIQKEETKKKESNNTETYEAEENLNYDDSENAQVSEAYDEQDASAAESNVSEEVSQENNANTSTQETEREDSGIEDYDGPASDFETLNVYRDGEGTKIHLEGTRCTLENEAGKVMTEFEGDRVEDTMPVYTNSAKLVVDNQEKFYRIYNAMTGALLCDVDREANCILTDELLVYEKDGIYTVKNFNNVELFSVEKGKNDKFLNSSDEKARFVFRNSYFVYQADEGRTLITNVGVVIAQGLDSISFNDENSTKESDVFKIYICEKDGKYGAFNAVGDRILNFDYQNIEFFNGSSSALRVTQKKGKVGVVDYTGQVIVPLEYESVGYGNMIVEASDSTIVEYLLLSAEKDQYYGKIGNRIYYLDEDGNRSDEVRYVRIEEKGRDINDYLSLGEAAESPKEYRTTGNVLVMNNCFVNGLAFGRSEIYQKVEQDKIQFLLVDAMNGKIGICTHYYGKFSMMGYQYIFWYAWMICSRLFVILFAAWILCFINYEDISDTWYFFWKKQKKKWKRKHNGK